jgi:ArsR family transcriptional regulator
LRWPESTPDDQTVRVFRVLGNPIRLRILWLLAHREEFGVEIDPCCDGEVVCVCRIKALFDISAPDLSHHLRVLREAGLVDAQRAGIWTHYSLRSESFATVLEVMSQLHGTSRIKAHPAGSVAASDADREADPDMGAAEVTQSGKAGRVR